MFDNLTYCTLLQPTPVVLWSVDKVFNFSFPVRFAPPGKDFPVACAHPSKWTTGPIITLWVGFWLQIWAVLFFEGRRGNGNHQKNPYKAFAEKRKILHNKSRQINFLQTRQMVQTNLCIALNHKKKHRHTCAILKKGKKIKYVTQLFKKQAGLCLRQKDLLNPVLISFLHLYGVSLPFCVYCALILNQVMKPWNQSLLLHVIFIHNYPPIPSP